MDPRYLYLMLSQTPTGMGRLIRLCTGYEFNHVSLSLDPALRKWVSFARYAEDVPLAGGFVEESPERFCPDGRTVQVRIYRIALTQARFLELQRLFAMAGSRDSGLIYNSFSALFTMFGHKCRISGAYTCLDFACLVLGRDFASLRELDASNGEELIYQGFLADFVPVKAAGQDPYFTRRGFVRGLGDTVLHFTRLCARPFFHFRDPLEALR